ncbi:MAG: 4-phosphopantetheinyl transferase [Blastocatellia bacterium]|nr:4-phosphopantetheinyl transferase [Blastocatellia bacterium]
MDLGNPIERKATKRLSDFRVDQTVQTRIGSSQTWPSPPNRSVLGATDVHVWRLSLEQSTETVQRLRQLLSPDEQARANAFHFENDRRHFIVARGCLRIILAGYLEIAPAEIEFSYAQRGKPQLAASVSQLKFNLAHSGSLALYALTLIGEVGIDLEHIRTDFTGDDIAKRFFSVTEADYLSRLPERVRHEAFLNCWTRKEAFLKAKGTGLSLRLDQFDVTLAPAEPAALLRTGWDETEAARWSLEALDVGRGYIAAVAVESYDWQLSCWQFDEESLRRFI